MALNLTLRKTFLYIFASVGLVLCIIATVSLINLGLKTYVFTKADNYCNYSYAPRLEKDGTSVEPTQAQIDLDRKNCEEQRAASKQSQASNAIAMLIVGLPLYAYHWMVIRRDKEI
jgi:hypothetical protein